MDFHYEWRRDHLYVCAEGAFDACRARVELCNIIRQSASSGIGRILVDARGLTDLVPIGDRHALATQLADLSQGRVRMAIVVAPMNLFTQTFEDTATNRGLSVRTTASMGEALEFLAVALQPPRAA